MKKNQTASAEDEIETINKEFKETAPLFENNKWSLACVKLFKNYKRMLHNINQSESLLSTCNKSDEIIHPVQFDKYKLLSQYHDSFLLNTSYRF